MKSIDSTFFDRDYYQNGIKTGKSGYENYRWLPELTLPMAMCLIDYLHIGRDHKILDFGCAYGFLVKAFRMLYRQAWGFDISKHAIENVDAAVKQYCFNSYNLNEIPEYYDFCIAKDVFEHIDYGCIGRVLSNLNSKNLFVVVPLGCEGCYVAPYNNLDKSHIICEGLDWWLDTLEDQGWDLVNFAYRIDGIKDIYYKEFPKAHGFIWCRRDASL